MTWLMLLGGSSETFSKYPVSKVLILPRKMGERTQTLTGCVLARFYEAIQSSSGTPDA